MVVSKVKKLVLTRPNKRECVRFVASILLHHAQRALSTLTRRERGDFEKLLEQNETDSVQALQQRSMSIWNELLLFTRIGRERWWREENDNFGRRITYFDDADFGGLSRRFKREEDDENQ